MALQLGLVPFVARDADDPPAVELAALLEDDAKAPTSATLVPARKPSSNTRNIATETIS